MQTENRSAHRVKVAAAGHKKCVASESNGGTIFGVDNIAHMACSKVLQFGVAIWYGG